MVIKGTIFDIQRFSIHDGPGIRTTVFLKGCNLRCFWCHNPESINFFPEVQYFSEKCIGCGNCFEVCPENAHKLKEGKKIFLQESCQGCGRCVEKCYVEALILAGEEMTVAQVIEEVAKDIPFYKNSGGGVTFSGGEPLLQPEFVKALLVASKKKELHTAIDTAGNIPWKNFEMVLPYTDLFLYDLKVYDEIKHNKVTGVSNKRILENIKKLAKKDVEIWIRIPVIPGVNENIQEMEKISGFITQLTKVKLVELLPFHKLGQSKYNSLGLKSEMNELNTPQKESMEELVELFRAKGINTKMR